MPMLLSGISNIQRQLLLTALDSDVKSNTSLHLSSPSSIHVHTIRCETYNIPHHYQYQTLESQAGKRANSSLEADRNYDSFSVYGNSEFGTWTCHLLLQDIRDSVAIKTADTRGVTPSLRASYCLEHHGRSTRTHHLTSQKTAQLILSVTLRSCTFKHRDLVELKQLSTRIMKARNTLSTLLQGTNHRK
jgi:hypothetical protein